MKEKRLVCLGIALILLVMLICGIALEAVEGGTPGSFEATIVYELSPLRTLPISFLFPALF